MTINFYKSTSDKKISKKAYKIFYEEIKNRKKKYVVISGGNSLKKFFLFITSKKNNINNINFVLSDERIVNEKSKYSNSSMIKKNLINKINKLKKPNFIYPSIQDTSISNKKICKEYNNKIKILPHMAFLGIGDDGHVASIFNKGAKVQYTKYPLLICKKKKEKFRRISMDLKYLIKIPKLIIIILDKKKRDILKKILNYKNEVLNLPILDILTKSKSDIHILYNKNIIK